MFLHPEHMLREQQRRHRELLSDMAAERRATAARPSRHRFGTTVRRVRAIAARLWRYLVLAASTRHRIPAAEPAAPARTGPQHTSKAAATVHTAES